MISFEIRGNGISLEMKYIMAEEKLPGKVFFWGINDGHG